MGLITAEDVKANIYDGSPYTADYEFAAEKRLTTLRKAFSNIDDKIKADIEKFDIENPWLSDYAVYMAIKELENGRPWWEWSSERAHYSSYMKHAADYENAADFWKFVQYIFFKQWFDIKDYANDKGIAVIGDMPIYVAMDSVDVWSNLPLFLIDEKTLKVEKVAGVPPDYFSENGQLWGNPIYDWKAMKKDGYGVQWRFLHGKGRKFRGYISKYDKRPIYPE